MSTVLMQFHPLMNYESVESAAGFQNQCEPPPICSVSSPDELASSRPRNSGTLPTGSQRWAVTQQDGHLEGARPDWREIIEHKAHERGNHPRQLAYLAMPTDPTIAKSQSSTESDMEGSQWSESGNSLNAGLSTISGSRSTISSLSTELSCTRDDVDPYSRRPSQQQLMDEYLHQHGQFDLNEYHQTHIGQEVFEDCEILTRPRLTKEQVEVLENQFQTHPKPNSNVKRQLAIQTNLSLPRISVRPRYIL
jgi:hypothetical protein